MQCSGKYASFHIAILAMILALLDGVSAYRPVQHCKHDGENGHYSGCVGLTTVENATNGHLDLYVRYHWYRYENTNIGWHAVGLGNQMTGSHMLIMYGDPMATDPTMTVSVRTADGHRPPRPVEEFKLFEDHGIPQVEVRTAKFEEYTGPYVHPELNKPTHVGIMECVIPNFAFWPGTTLDDVSTHQAMVWASNSRQDFEGDFSPTRNIEMHAFGLGFGFLWVDLKNAKTPQPMFGPIDEMAGVKGASEVKEPDAPTQEELEAGDKYMASILGPGDEQHNTDVPEENLPSSEHDTDPNHGEDSEIPGAETQPTDDDDHENSDTHTHDDDESSIEQPARTILGKTLRDWMWHLHGLIMCLAFLILYPLGTYLLRRPPVNGNGFNSHWTIQSLASVAVLAGAAIGYTNSSGISVTHQFVGLAMVGLIAIQSFMGWRHHVVFVATHRRTLFSKAHIWTGRVILPLGFFNIITGMLLRGYGWLTMILVVVLVVLESSFLTFVLTSNRNVRTDDLGRDAGIAMRDQEAEEYFQLAEDDDDWSDDEQRPGPGRDGVSEGAAQRLEEKRKQAERLAKLDKV